MKRPFEQAVTEHGTVVLRVCRAVLGVEEADDADVRAWLVTIAHRKAIDVARARGRRAFPVEQLPERVASPADHPEQALPDEALWSALAALPDKQRQCVAYHHVAGLPHTEVAAIVGGTPAAARRACADGIARLRLSYASPTPRRMK